MPAVTRGHLLQFSLVDEPGHSFNGYFAFRKYVEDRKYMRHLLPYLQIERDLRLVGLVGGAQGVDAFEEAIAEMRKDGTVTAW